jgi:hypothetical protein
VLLLTLIGRRIKHLLIQNVVTAAATSQSRLFNLRLQVVQLLVIMLLVFSAAFDVALFLVNVIK